MGLSRDRWPGIPEYVSGARLTAAAPPASPQAGAPVTIHAFPRARSDSVTARAAR